ncbi:hypothetical protein BOTCAL_0063g00160 [Botryotinia calthae]|uniref:Cupin 2 conserved barrel domain-containing protein n=1 Tax=Botryotinia calthae TaxID=38488 RepID=A0A4Y8DC39_9HELO|nr:hypothetical protein BOTCAL_0063g00160 [Botryotinia calthae]
MSSYTPNFDNKCYITTNSPDGKTTTFVDSTSFVTRSQAPGVTLQFAYSAVSPPSFIDDADLKAHQETIKQEKTTTTPSAGNSSAVLCHLDPNPSGTEGFMHRTRTLDYVTIMDGELGYTVNSGEKRVFKKGDVVIQRSGWHAWTNLSKTEGATFFAVVVGAEGATEDFMEMNDA